MMILTIISGYKLFYNDQELQDWVFDEIDKND